MSYDGDCPGHAPGTSEAEGRAQRVTEQSSDFDRGLSMVASVAGALDAAELEHWFFGGWAVDFGWAGSLDRTTTSTSWFGERTRPVSTRRSREPAGSTRRLLRTWSAPTTRATAMSFSSPSWWPATKD